MKYETVLLDVTDGFATVTLNRPTRLNALTGQLFAEMTAAIDAGIAAGARALVLTGAGDAFCAGADLTAAIGPGIDLGDTLERDYNPFARKLAGLDIPVVTAVNGPAVGAGLGIALLGDIVVAARSAYFQLAFVNIGLVPDAGSTWLGPTAGGRAKALELALLGERIPAEDAHAAGLVTRVADDALAEARAIAAKLARGPSVAIALIRRQVAAALTLDLDATLMLESANQSKAGGTADFAEAVAAFREKRPAQFAGV